VGCRINVHTAPRSIHLCLALCQSHTLTNTIYQCMDFPSKNTQKYSIWFWFEVRIRCMDQVLQDSKRQQQAEQLLWNSHNNYRMLSVWLLYHRGSWEGEIVWEVLLGSQVCFTIGNVAMLSHASMYMAECQYLYLLNVSSIVHVACKMSSYESMCKDYVSTVYAHGQTITKDS
jgi:hypothetical protein